MKRFTAVIAASMLDACAGFSPQAPPGPQPQPPPWVPETALRSRLPRGPAADVVLDERDGLSPAEAAVLAVDQNPMLRAARADRGVGQAELLSAGVLPNPRFEGAVDFPVSGPDARVIGYGAGLTWNVTPLVSRAARVGSAEESLASIDLDIAWQEWQVAEAARLHTLRSIYLERRVALERELEQTWQQRFDALRGARAQGAVTELEVTNAERSLADARTQRLDMEQQAVAERAELNRTLGIDPSRDVVLDTSFRPTETVPEAAALLKDLPRRRLDLIALQHAHLSHDEALRAAVLAQFPPVEVGVHARRELDQNASIGLALSFELPFFDRNQAGIARERALRVRVTAEYDARLLEARASVVRIVKESSIAQAQFASAREGSTAAVRLAEQARIAAGSGALSPLLAADILERAYASRLRVLEVEQTLAELEVALALASGVDVR
jgi:outer membrane protein TolC